MELEFDKEIDAILRRARPARGVLVGDDPPEKHLDADTIAAFAENALPPEARQLHLEHFADCDRCRRLLSQTMLLNSEPDRAAASPVSAPTAETIPWYDKLFKTQNLELAAGALVLVFTGALGYLVIQNDKGSRNATVSQITEPETSRGGPYFGGDAETSNSSAAAQTSNPINTANAAANTAAANSMATGSGISSNAAAPGTLGRLDSADEKPAPMDDKNLAPREVAGLPKPEAAPPPPLVTMDGVSVNEKKADASKLKEGEKDLALSSQKQSEDRRNRDAPPSTSKSGPVRSGPLQNQSNQTNRNVIDMAVRRNVGGKTFENRDGAWYDSAYRGQATTNYRRSTEEYKKLDRGLRNIADTIGGTVVVVWKDKAYRIQ